MKQQDTAQSTIRMAQAENALKIKTELMVEFRRVRRDLKKLQELNCKNKIEKLKRDIMNMKKSHRRALNLYAKEMYVHRRGDFESGRAALTLCASRRWLSSQELSHVLALNSNVRKNVWATLESSTSDDVSSVSRLSEKRLWSPAKVCGVRAHVSVYGVA